MVGNVRYTKAFGYKIKYLSKNKNAKCKVSQDQSFALLTVFRELILLLFLLLFIFCCFVISSACRAKIEAIHNPSVKGSRVIFF